MACAVSYATPIRHLNHRTIDRDFTTSAPTHVRSRAAPLARGKAGGGGGDAGGGDAALAAARAAAVADHVGNPFTSLEDFSPSNGAGAGDATGRRALPPAPPPPPPPFPTAASRMQTRDLFSWMRRLGTLRYVKYPSVRLATLRARPCRPCCLMWHPLLDWAMPTHLSMLLGAFALISRSPRALLCQWRPKGSLLTHPGRSGGPCWKLAEMQTALRRPSVSRSNNPRGLPRGAVATRAPCSLLLAPCSLLLAPCSLLPATCSLLATARYNLCGCCSDWSPARASCVRRAHSMALLLSRASRRA